jgi:MFS family permease
VEQSGLLYTVYTLSYLVFSFFAAEIAFKVGEWKAIITGTAVFSTALLLLGPIPIFRFWTGGGGEGGVGGKAKVLGLRAGTLAVLGLSETFIFLPFVPLLHSKFQGRLGWSEEETEDVVSCVWYVPSLLPSLFLRGLITTPSTPSLPPSPPSQYKTLTPFCLCSPFAPSLPPSLPSSLRPNQDHSMGSRTNAGAFDRRVADGRHALDEGTCLRGGE